MGKTLLKLKIQRYDPKRDNLTFRSGKKILIPHLEGITIRELRGNKIPIRLPSVSQQSSPESSLFSISTYLPRFSLFVTASKAAISGPAAAVATATSAGYRVRHATHTHTHTTMQRLMRLRHEDS